MNSFSNSVPGGTRSLAGTRIRERRATLGIKQSALAKQVGISSSYLNLIEHNRRRIAGKLLLDIAAALQTDAALLAEGAELSLLNDLRAAAMASQDPPEPETTEEFAARYPAWAALIAEQGRKMEALENTIAALSDRLAHDPFLSASLHEMLSTVTSIRSSASILTGPDPVEPVWQDRFHKNIFEDAVRLGDASQALVTYLDAPQAGPSSNSTPLEEVESYLDERQFYLPNVEAGGEATGFTGTAQGQALLDRYAARLREEAVRVPTDVLLALVRQEGLDPLRLTHALGVPMQTLLRRLAQVPLQGTRVGLVECDASGTLTLRRSLDGFPLPRYGDACALWPLFGALSRPHMPIATTLRSLGAKGELIQAFAVAAPDAATEYGQDPIMRSTMLLVPVQQGDAPALEVGMSCRVCPKSACPARREPSILADGF